MAISDTTQQNNASTQAVHAGRDRRQPNNSLTTPLVQTATYTFADTTDLIDYMEAKAWGNGADHPEYGRYGNPTVRAVEKRLAALEGAEDAALFASGMAAVTNTLLSMLPSGSHIILTDDCYRRTRQFVLAFLKRLGIENTVVPMGDYDALEKAIRPITRLILSESPTNPYLRVVDLERVVEIGKRHRVKTMIDTTFATPINVRPLEYGIDLVIHSVTKYLSGHNDVLAGVVAGKSGIIGALRDSRGVLGAIVDPHAAWLIERGIKTLGLRVRQQNTNALTVARFLEDHPRVNRVWYPGLDSHPDYEIAKRQMRGYGGVISFEVGNDLEETGRFIDALEIPSIAPSLGGVESLVEQPARMSYYEMTSEERAAIGISDTLVRYAVGIEDTHDLVEDLSRAFLAF
jgi:cystathionine gamma-synthase